MMSHVGSSFSHRILTLDHHSEITMYLNADGVHEHRILKYKPSEEIRSEPNMPFAALTEAAKMAACLYEKYRHNGELVLTLSGGIDSQAMLFSFIESGVPFRVAIMRFKDRMNEHDIGHCLDLLTSLGIKPQIFDLDIQRFYDSGQYMDYAVAGRTNSPQFAAHIWLANKIEGIPVFAGEPWHRIHDTVDVPAEKSLLPFYFPRYKEYGAEIALLQQNRICISHFFEISMKWFQHVALMYPLHRYCRDSDPEGSYRAKYLFYRRMGFPVSLTSGMSKLNGFERLYSLTAIENNVSDYYHFNRIYREPLEKLFPPPSKRTVQCDGLSGEFWEDMRSLELLSQNSK